MAFATNQDLADYLQDSSLSAPAATLALDIATGRIISATGQRFAVSTDDTITLTGGNATLALPGYPVTAVGAVTVQMFAEPPLVVVPEVDFYRTGSTLVWAPFYPRANANPWRQLAWFNPLVWPDRVTVVYTHGYATIPADVKGVCLALAAELVESPSGINYEHVDDYAWRREAAEKSPATRALEALVKSYGCRTYSVRTR
jgi:hypothetical protein